LGFGFGFTPATMGSKWPPNLPIRGAEGWGRGLSVDVPPREWVTNGMPVMYAELRWLSWVDVAFDLGTKKGRAREEEATGWRVLSMVTRTGSEGEWEGDIVELTALSFD
jgi:hypothetical protein